MKKELKEKLKEQFDIIVQSSKNSTSDDIVELGMWAYNLAKSEDAERIKKLETLLKESEDKVEPLEDMVILQEARIKELEEILKDLSQHPDVGVNLQIIIADKLTPPKGL